MIPPLVRSGRPARRSASGCPAARPARRPTRSRWCSSSRWRRRGSSLICRSSRPTSTRRARARARRDLSGDSPPTSRRRACGASSTRTDTPTVSRRTLRETVMFAPQNLLRDPPFSRLDLISCRNVLMYLEPAPEPHRLAAALRPRARRAPLPRHRRDDRRARGPVRGRLEEVAGLPAARADAAR